MTTSLCHVLGFQTLQLTSKGRYWFFLPSHWHKLLIAVAIGFSLFISRMSLETCAQISHTTGPSLQNFLPSQGVTMRVFASAVLINFSVMTYAQFFTAPFLCHRGKVLSDSFRGKTTHARSKIGCLQSVCPDNSLLTCAASFRPTDRQCIASSSPADHVTANLGSALDDASDWTTLIARTSAPPFVRPPVLWPLTSTSKGRNEGSRGSDLDLVITGLTSWNADGPRASGPKVLAVTTSNQAYIQLMKNGNRLLKFDSQFSLGAWIKTNGPEFISIFEGDPHESLAFMLFKFNSSNDEFHFRVAYPGHYYRAILSAASNKFWRHAAVVYRGVGDIQFFLNGSTVPITTSMHTDTHVNQPSKLLFGRTAMSSKYNFHIACFAVYERALEQNEIAKLMQSCPWLVNTVLSVILWC